jgi:hypothetical protein
MTFGRFWRWATAVVAILLPACAGPSAAGRGTPLFNGRDFTGFYTWLKTQGVDRDPDGVFAVANGEVRVSGREFGYFATKRDYENYRLTAEFKWGVEAHPPRKDNARDSGILFHVQGPDAVWPKSIEFQIIEGGTGDILAVAGASCDFDESMRPFLAGNLSPDGKRLAGGRINWWGRSPEWKDVLGFRGPRDLEKPLGEWNTVELIADGGSFTFFVNGTLAAKGTGAEPRKGRILFQSEGAEIVFRDIRLQPLDARPR